MAPPRYAELRAKSCFSFLEGASHPEELVARASELGLAALALADVNGLYGIVRGHAEAKRRGLPLVVGAELVVAGLELGRAARLVLLARDREGYAGLCRLVTLAHGGEGWARAPGRREKEDVKVALADVAARARGLFALYPGADGDAAARLRDVFGRRLALAVARHRVAGEEARNLAARAVGKRLGIPVAVTNDVHTHARARQRLQDVLTCVRHGTTVDRAGRRLFPNAERTLKGPDEMARLWGDFPEGLEAAAAIADECRFRMEEIRGEHPLPPVVLERAALAGGAAAALSSPGQGEREVAAVPSHRLRTTAAAAPAATSTSTSTSTPTPTSTSTSTSTSTPTSTSTSTATPPSTPEAGEEIVVTATRGPRPVRDAPAHVDVTSRTDIDRSPTKTIDELLRADPAFTIFRRSSSLAADPSSQGVKLRNVAASGVTRTLVLVDGIPENDAFAGWVSWRALPRIGLDRVEIVPGGGSALYGNYALGGVVQAFSTPIRPMDVDVTAEYGDFGTGIVSGRIADRRGPVGASLEGELLRSDGYLVAAPCPAAGPGEQCRGAVDQPASSEHAAVRGRLESRAGQDLTLDARGGYFWEDFNGGTTYTTAGVRRFEYAAGAHWTPPDSGDLDLSVFGHHADFTQDRARIDATRTTESQSAHQDVPTDDVGASLVWRARPLYLAGTHTLSLGVDGRWVWGETREQLFPASTPPPGPTTTVQRNAEGQQRLYGVFAQDVYDVTPAIGASLAVRWDRWENLNASRVETALSGAVTPTDFADRSGGELSPKLGLTFRLAPWASARAAAYRAFRIPTLDELYRPFQVGTVRTDANENLVPETLVGAEAGFDLGTRRGPTLRLTGFWNELRDPIVNVTTGANSQQRQNLGKAEIKGVQADVEWRFARRWSAGAAYTLAATRITDAPGQEFLVGVQLPQSPKHLATFSLAFDDPRLVTVSAQVRYLGDQNERLPAPGQGDPRPLGDVWLADVFAAWHLGARLDLYLAVENVLDETYLVGRAGLDTIGQPRFVHGGVRVRVGG